MVFGPKSLSFSWENPLHSRQDRYNDAFFDQGVKQEMVKEPMTQLGFEQIQELLHRLITVSRPAVLAAIAEARGHGDVSENAELDAAKEEQALLEGRISTLQDKIARAQVIEPSKLQMDKVAFGATISLVDVNTEQEVVYQIVGEDEADIKGGKISIHSPLARALVGKREGDDVMFKAPGGTKEYEIDEIRYV